VPPEDKLHDEAISLRLALSARLRRFARNDNPKPEETGMQYQTIAVRKLTPHIGAEIAGVDLSRPLGNQQFRKCTTR
jgi:hypothetical protein